MMQDFPNDPDWLADEDEGPCGAPCMCLSSLVP